MFWVFSMHVLFLGRHLIPTFVGHLNENIDKTLNSNGANVTVRIPAHSC